MNRWWGFEGKRVDGVFATRPSQVHIAEVAIIERGQGSIGYGAEGRGNGPTQADYRRRSFPKSVITGLVGVDTRGSGAG